MRESLLGLVAQGIWGPRQIRGSCFPTRLQDNHVQIRGVLGDIYCCWHLGHTSAHVLLALALVTCVKLRMH